MVCQDAPNTRRRCAPSGFTLIELTVAAGLMTIIMVMLYTIFGSASHIFSGADARIEIFQTTRAVVDTMQRDLQGAIVDDKGNVFRGWNRAWAWARLSGMSSTPDLPALTLIQTSLVDAYYWPSLPGGYLSQVTYGAVPYTSRDQCVWVPDMVWFRTTTEASNFGIPTEVIYRLAYRYNLGYTFVLEKGISRQLTDSDISTANLTTYLARFQFTPIGMHVREFQLRYYRADVANASADVRVAANFLHTEWGQAQIRDGLYGCHWYDYWPPQDTADPNTGTASAHPAYIFDNARDASGNLVRDSSGSYVPRSRRARIPAAVQVTLRVGDSSDREWGDYYSTNIVDGRDEPLPASNFSQFSQTTQDPPLDRMKQTNTAADEVGIVFRQVIFIPNYIKALGPRRGDM